MRILILNYEFPPLGGGGGRVSQNLAEEWSHQGHQVDVVTSHFKNLPKFEKQSGFNLYRVSILGRKDIYTATFISMLSYLFSGFLKGWQLCRKDKYDVINTHFAIPTGPLGVFLSKIFRIKNILDIHGGDIYNPTRKISPHKNILFKQIVQWVLNNSDKIIAHSEDIKKQAIKYYQPMKEIIVIPLGFKPIKFKKVNRRELRLKDNVFYLISIGRLVKRKGYDYLIKALQSLDSNVQLLLIGEGPERKRLESLAENLGISDRIKFLGFVSDEKKFQYLSVSDLYVLPSLHEGFGIVLQEAMYCGLPIITTKCGGPKDFLEDKKNALFIDSKSVNSCVATIQELKNNKDLAHRIGQTNKEKIKEFYIDKMAKKYLQLSQN